MYEIIPADKLVPAEDNVRRHLGSLKELTASIAAVGVIEPLVVTPRADGSYLVVAGHRRLAAGTTAGLTEFPCVVREMDDIERLVTGLVENLARSDLNVMDEAAGLFRLVEYGLSVSALAKRLGRSAKHVSTRLTLLELPKAAQTELAAGRLTVAEATALLALRDHPDAIGPARRRLQPRRHRQGGHPGNQPDRGRDQSRRGPRRAGGGRRARRGGVEPLQRRRPFGGSAWERPRRASCPHGDRRPLRSGRTRRRSSAPRRGAGRGGCGRSGRTSPGGCDHRGRRAQAA